jgi:hypothetical protein
MKTKKNFVQRMEKTNSFVSKKEEKKLITYVESKVRLVIKLLSEVGKTFNGAAGDYLY